MKYKNIPMKYCEIFKKIFFAEYIKNILNEYFMNNSKKYSMKILILCNFFSFKSHLKYSIFHWNIFTILFEYSHNIPWNFFRLSPRKKRYYVETLPGNSNWNFRGIFVEFLNFHIILENFTWSFRGIFSKT